MGVFAGHIQARIGRGFAFIKRTLRQGGEHLRAGSIAAPEGFGRISPHLVGIVLQVEIVDKHAVVRILLCEHGIDETALPGVHQRHVRLDFQQLGRYAVQIVRAAALAAGDILPSRRIHDMEEHALRIVVQLGLVIRKGASAGHASLRKLVIRMADAHEFPRGAKRGLLAGLHILIHQGFDIGNFAVGVLHAPRQPIVILEEHSVKPPAAEESRRLQVNRIAGFGIQLQKAVHDAARLGKEVLRAATVGHLLAFLLGKRRHQPVHALCHPLCAVQRLAHAKGAIYQNKVQKHLVDAVHHGLNMGVGVDAVAHKPGAVHKQPVHFRGNEARRAGFRRLLLALQQRPGHVQRALPGFAGDRVVHALKGRIQIAHGAQIVVIVILPAIVGPGPTDVQPAVCAQRRKQPVGLQRKQPLRVFAHLPIDARALQRPHRTGAGHSQRSALSGHYHHPPVLCFAFESRLRGCLPGEACSVWIIP